MGETIVPHAQPPIEDYGLLSNRQTTALVAHARVDWWCVPRVDSDAVFAALPGGDEHGYWRIAPVAATETGRAYRQGPFILDTDCAAPKGVGKKHRLPDRRATSSEGHRRASIGGMDVTDNETRIVTAERTVRAPAPEIFEWIAEPTRQPGWDGNDNLDVATTAERVRAVGDVFGMRTNKGKSKENRIVAFEEGRTIAWLTADAGHEPPGHIWRRDLEPLDDGTTRVIHTYDWTGVTDEARWPRHRQTTPANLLASIDRLAAVVERHA